jgi:hypothetical protein
MTFISIEDYTFNPEAIDLVKGGREDYCEVFFRGGEKAEFRMSQKQFKDAILKQAWANRMTTPIASHGSAAGLTRRSRP